MTNQGTAPDPEGSGASSRPGDVVDLDALRAARIEAIGDRKVMFGGREWSLVAEMPFEFAEVWASRRRRDCIGSLLLDPSEADEFMALRPSNEDFEALLGAFRVTSGKSEAS